MKKRSKGNENPFYYTRWYSCTCEVCGASYQAKRYNSIYCSDACKQKAYRERRAQRKIADSRTMHMDDLAAIHALIDWHSDAKNVLESIHDAHGQQAMIDAAHLAAWVGGLGPHS